MPALNAYWATGRQTFMITKVARMMRRVSSQRMHHNPQRMIRWNGELIALALPTVALMSAMVPAEARISVCDVGASAYATGAT